MKIIISNPVANIVAVFLFLSCFLQIAFQVFMHSGVVDLRIQL
uniref:Uncharacterized protein n=1 Tax=Nelumbo nucifera TaxID=4432 RepID=A0A822XGG3_NELNU|nr:TPA_asm: hypothetical protein HUJ06_020780 [Nelumbo nucifera]